MATRRTAIGLALGMMLSSHAAAAQEPAGSLRGAVTDRDFGGPLAGVTVRIQETGRQAVTSDQGLYAIADVAPGVYTLSFAREGYLRETRAGVEVAAGRVTEADAALAGEYIELEEFVVEDVLALEPGTEEALIVERLESPSLLDSIGKDLIGLSGSSDAAAALRLVPGATLKDGKSAVIRGLPDRYVSSQLNGVRLPTADEDKRAVELDQFPASVIESIEVSKTFTPDQQGDASGGAVDVRLKGIPDEPLLQFKAQTSQNSQVAGSDFLTYEGGGVNALGRDEVRGQQLDDLEENWEGAVGVTRGEAPSDSKWSLAAGGTEELMPGVRIGGFASVFYERDSSFHDNGRDDSYWVDEPGGEMVPETNQGAASQGDFKTALFDVTQGSESVQWGGLGAVGIASENHELTLSYLYVRTAEDVATLAEDTRGKEYFFPGYDPDDPKGTGNEKENRNAAPYLRLETLEYTERTTDSLQLKGRHVLPTGDLAGGEALTLHAPELDWSVARSGAGLNQPDKRQFGALWLAPSYDPGAPPFIDPFTRPAEWFPYAPDANFTLGNLQRIWKRIEEESDQYAANLKFPFTQWSGAEGYLKAGVFDDRLDRVFDQDTFSNFNDAGASFEGGWDEYWSEQFPEEEHPITESLTDVDYRGGLDVSAWYAMLDLPLFPGLNLVGGARRESTAISIVNEAEEDAMWFPPGATAPVALTPGAADVAFEQEDTLPSVGLIAAPVERLTLRASFSKTIARQTFKELTPVIQQEYLGGPIFIGNPDLGMSSLDNWDLRADWEPFDGGLLSASWFRKDIRDPIEYVQRVGLFSYTSAVNYPEGELSGFELEARQHLGEFWRPLGGLAVGANATFLDARVTLPEDEQAGFELPNILAPMDSRDMVNAPEHLYNLFLTYDLEATGTLFGVFYTVTGDTLLAGAGQTDGNFVPSIYAVQHDSLNLSVSQRLGRHFTLQFQAKNVTDPLIRTVYRSEYIGDDVTHTSYTRGVEYSLSLTAEVAF